MMTHITMGIIGHFNSGKSTLCNKLLYKNIKGVCSTTHACIMKKRLLTKHYNYTLIDIPGDIKYFIQIINGISLSDVILCVVSSIETEFDLYEKQTQEYLQICHMVGIRQIIFVINKMDKPTIYYSKQSYNKIVDKINKIFKKIGFSSKEINKIQIIPISCLTVDNLQYKSIINMEWYNGFTLIDTMDNQIKVPKRPNDKPFKLSVFDVIRHDIIIGKIIEGKISVFDKVKIYPSGIKSAILSIHVFNEHVHTAYCGYIIGIKLILTSDDIIKRGNIISIDTNKKQKIIRQFSALIYVKKSKKRLYTKYNKKKYGNADYLQFSSSLFINNATSKCNILSIKWKQNQSKKTNKKIHISEFIQKYDKAKVIFELVQPIHIEPFKKNKKFGTFIIMNRDDGSGTKNNLNQVYIIGKILSIVKTSNKQSIYMIGHYNYKHKFKLMDSNGYRGKVHLEDGISSDKLTLIRQRFRGLCMCIDKVYSACRHQIFVCDSNPIPFAPHVANHHIWGIPGAREHGIIHNLHNLNGVNVFDIKSTNEYSVALCSSNDDIIDCVCSKMARKMRTQIPSVIINIINGFYKLNNVYKTRDDEAKWVSIKTFKHIHIMKIEVGKVHSLFLDSLARLWCLGRNNHGQLGLGSRSLYYDKSKPCLIKYFVDNKIKIKDVKCGVYHNLSMDENGNIYTFGDNDYGQCGDGTLDQVDEPKRILEIDKKYKETKKIKCGAYHSYMLIYSLEHQIDQHFLFGSNYYNECTLNAHSKASYVKSPYCINDVVKHQINSVSLGYETTTLFVCD
eukprot:217599_1